MRIAARLGVVFAASAVAGCAGGPGPGMLAGSSYAPYQAASAFAPTGYSEKDIDETRVEVSATGTEVTSKERVERIALARAAEIGQERGMKALRVVSVRHGVTCQKMQDLYRATVPERRAPTVTLDIVYSKKPVPEDPSFLASEETFARVRAELDQELYAPDAASAASTALKAQCGV